MAAPSLRIGYLTVVQCILERGTETVNKSTDGGETPLHIASANGHLEAVKTLLAATAEVDKSTDGGETALILASANGHPR